MVTGGSYHLIRESRDFHVKIVYTTKHTTNIKIPIRYEFNCNVYIYITYITKNKFYLTVLLLAR